VGVRPGRRDHPVAEQRDPVGQRDRGRPVRDQQRGRLGQQPAQRLGHPGLGVHVQRGQRVVQDEQ
jgi:hypothetical protein